MHIYFAVLVPKNLDDTKVPTDWKHNTFIKLFKKGDKTLPGNWRGNSLLSIPSKLLVLLILHRIQSLLNKYLREEQHVLRPGRSCTDLVFTLWVLINNSRGWWSKLYMAFIYFEKAFDLLHCKTLWKLLTFFGIPEKLVALIMVLYKDSECCVKTTEGRTRYFRVLFCVKQGCVLSPFLFPLAIDHLLCNTCIRSNTAKHQTCTRSNTTKHRTPN